MRFLNSLKNSTLAFLGQTVTILLGFFVRWIFIHRLGQEYLGVNSVMESVLTLLSMTELGIGTSVAFALYKPIAENDEKRVGSLMAFYRRVYVAVGAATAVFGLAAMPFMGIFTKGANVENMNLIYILFLSNTVLSYFFSYKRTLFSAYQQNYVNSLTEDGFAIVKYILQCAAILCLKNYTAYIAYLVIHVVCSLGANAVISSFCNKKYPLVKKYKNEKMLEEDKEMLKKNVISLMYVKVGGKLVTGTDNLMISYANIALMGVYSNYSMVISIIDRVIESVLKAVMGSIGNLMVQNDNRHKYKVYEEFVFVGFATFFFISAVLSGCLERFIALFAGEGWVLKPTVTFVVIMNFFLHGMRQPTLAVIEAAGLFNQMRAKAVLEVLVNLVVSFLFLIVFDMGIYGVLFGTTVSKVGVCIWWEIMVVHRDAFELPWWGYVKKYVKNLLFAAVGCFASYFAAKKIPVEGFLGLILAAAVSSGIYAVLMLAGYINAKETKRLLGRFKKSEVGR